MLILDRDTGRFEDKTRQVARYQDAGGTIDVVFNSGPRVYAYGQDRARLLRDPARVAIPPSSRVEVCGKIWPGATEVWNFIASEGTWARVFYRKSAGEGYTTYAASQVRVVMSAPHGGVLDYYRDIVARLTENNRDDPLVREYRKLDFVNPRSTLAAYLVGAPIESRELAAPPIFPFRCNLSQRQAVENALAHRISVIEGPPGTGKTETILNLIANIIMSDQTVGVVSFTNTAVDNVREKLEAEGFGHVPATLGRHEKRVDFLAGQQARQARVEEFTAGAPEHPDQELLDDVDRRLRALQRSERERARLRQELDAHRLELRHFEGHLRSADLPQLAGLPLLHRSSDRILRYLAESELEYLGARPGLLGRIRKYFLYGSLRGLDPEDTTVVLRLQRAYYDNRISELEDQVERAEHTLRHADFDQLAGEHRRLSLQVLHAKLGTRYRGRSRVAYEERSYRQGKNFAEFVKDYPVMLSTCHALRGSLADNHLLDYLIIDEASQVDPLLAGLALSACHNLVVVGDLQQLRPIERKQAAELDPPSPAYDCRAHSILSSLVALYGEQLPRTLLQEHYRCDPTIIGFCNKSFYGGKLIPYTVGGERPMIVMRTVEGNHMRQYRDGGRINRRELDAIVAEVIPQYCEGFADSDIGVTTPYRRQADLSADMLDGPESDTVHKFQGRQKKAVILSTVLDETRRGRNGLRFTDDPQLINVAVSRAIKRFVLVTNHDLMPTSRHVADLIGYIRYHNPGEEVADSAVISVFDLLYQRYSERLRDLAARVTGPSRYLSENITWTVLTETLAEPPYAHLISGQQVLLANLFPDPGPLTPRQQSYLQNRASVDFVIYNRVTNEPRLAIEVDGFEYHANSPEQLARDEIKNEIFASHQLRLLRLPTTGSAEQERIRRELDEL